MEVRRAIFKEVRGMQKNRRGAQLTICVHLTMPTISSFEDLHIVDVTFNKRAKGEGRRGTLDDMCVGVFQRDACRTDHADGLRP